jgi:hypothetical protein
MTNVVVAEEVRLTVPFDVALAEGSVEMVAKAKVASPS